MDLSFSLQQVLQQRARQADKLIVTVIGVCFVYALILGVLNDELATSLLCGLPLLLAALACQGLIAGTLLSSVLLSVIGMLFVALQIHLAHGMIEMHFGVFVMLAFLATYRAWPPLLAAAITIAGHHLLFCYLQHMQVNVWLFSDMTNHWSRVFIHATYVVVETAFLLYFTRIARAEAVDGDVLSGSTARIFANEPAIDLGITLPHRSPVVDKFGYLLSELQRVIQEVKTLVAALGGSSASLTESSRQLNQASEAAMLRIDHVTHDIGTLASATSQITADAEGASDTVSTAIQTSQDARQAVGESTRASQALSQHLEVASQEMDQLNRACLAIGQVVNVITEVAEQTNLLALNAAIEAARAGEQGRGFAVVADEVRALAARTRQSTGEITGLIQTLQQGAEKTVTIMQQCAEGSALNRTSAERVAAALQALQQDLDSLTTLNRSIAAATRDQQTLVDTMLDHAQQVKAGNDQVRPYYAALQDIASQLGSEQASLDQHIRLFRT